MHVAAIIPARYGSSRFPGKPLAARTGKPLIQHVCERVRLATRIDRCIVATDDQRILDAVQAFGGEAQMTDPKHPSGTDRIAEVARAIGGQPDDIVLNVQGDEPEIEPGCLDRLVRRLIDDPACPVATLAAPFPVDGDPCSPDCVKVVLDRNGRALYFSRALVPYPRADAGRPRDPADWLLHLGVYGFRRRFLLEFAALPPTPLEQTEKLEQLRVLEHGHVIAVEVVERSFVGIDTPDEYEAFVRRCRAQSEAAHPSGVQ